MTRIHFWRLLNARYEEAEYPEPPACPVPVPVGPSNGKACGYPPAFVLTWTVNPSGLPGLGEDRTALVCGEHLRDRLDAIHAGQSAAAVTVTPYKEIP